MIVHFQSCLVDRFVVFVCNKIEFFKKLSSLIMNKCICLNNNPKRKYYRYYFYNFHSYKK